MSRFRFIVWPLWAIGIVFAAVVAAQLFSGPVEMGDTSRYLRGADALLATGSIPGKASSYKGYVLFVAAVKSLTGDPQLQKWLIAMFQALAAAIGLACLYSLGCMLFSRNAALVATGFYAVNFYALRWVPFIATEALFMAFVTIACWLCVKALQRPVVLVPAVLVTLFAVSIRPNGIPMLAAFTLFFVLSMSRWWRLGTLLSLAVAAILLAPGLKNTLNEAAAHENLVRHLEEGTIIWRVESMTMPELDERSGDQVVDVARYVTTYPVDTIELVARRLFAAWSWYRDDYSTKHKVFLGVAVPLIYLLAVIGLCARKQSGFSVAHLLPVLLVLAQSAVIAVSFVNHDHRFVISVMPMVFLFAGAGGAKLYEWALAERRASCHGLDYNHRPRP